MPPSFVALPFNNELTYHQNLLGALAVEIMPQYCLEIWWTLFQ